MWKQILKQYITIHKFKDLYFPKQQQEFLKMQPLHVTASNRSYSNTRQEENLVKIVYMTMTPIYRAGEHGFHHAWMRNMVRTSSQGELGFIHSSDSQFTDASLNAYGSAMIANMGYIIKPTPHHVRLGPLKSRMTRKQADICSLSQRRLLFTSAYGLHSVPCVALAILREVFVNWS